MAAVGYSRWQLADLQVHTPADRYQRYGDVGGPNPNPAFARRLIQAHADAGITVLAVTDHNRLDWYPELASAGAELGVTVFPGLEFNVNKCHLLAVWDRTEQGFQIAQQFLTTLFPPGTRPLTAAREPLPVTSGSPLDLARRAAREYQALVFAPHATAKTNGLFGKNVCNISDQVAQGGDLMGFDVWGNAGNDVLRNPRSQFGDIKPAWFVSGDVRSLEDVGQRVVYLKIDANPTLESLRQAFLMAEQRIRFPSRLRSTLGTVSGLRFLDEPLLTWPAIRRIQITGGFHDGLDIELGPGLNALIGGKGTGKSTIVEIIRHVTHAPKSTQPEGEGNRQANLPANAEARLGVVASDGGEYTLARPGDNQASRLLRNGTDVGVEPRRRFTVRVFGQRELAGLPNQPAALRQFLALNATEDLEESRTKERQLAVRVRQLGVEIRGLEAILADTTESEERLADLRDQLRQAAERGAADVIRDSQALSTARQQAESARGWPDSLTAAATSLRDDASPPQLTDHPSLPDGLRGTLESASAQLLHTAGVVDEVASSLKGNLDPLLAEHERRSLDSRRALNIRLADAGLSDPDELARKQREAADLEALVEKVPEQRRRLEGLTTERRSLLEQLRGERRRMSRALESAAVRLTQQAGDRVRVTIQPLADQEPLRAKLGELLSGQSVRSDQLTKLAALGPGALSDAFASGANGLVSRGVTGSAAAKVLSLRPDQLRQLEECPTPDLVDVEVDLGQAGASRWVLLNEVSPGQRATAMLSLALASGDEPLVIDQPEDDLDNRYIYEQVIRVLSDVADRRQVIVATHNANIPVLGDAELVLALTATADRSEILACGGLDDPVVAGQAREILEGGDEAFQARARRYRRQQ